MYLFTTDSGVEYEVRFGRSEENILAASIVFGVLNDEFAQEESGEYSVVNRGEVYNVLATISDVVRMYMKDILFLPLVAEVVVDQLQLT